MKPRKKRIDECLFCTSRSCFVRIFSEQGKYDEIACQDHTQQLETHCDNLLGVNNGVLRTYISGSALKRRGELL